MAPKRRSFPLCQVCQAFSNSARTGYRFKSRSNPRNPDEICVECRLIKGEWYIKNTYPSSFPFQSRSSHFFISPFAHFSRGFGLGLYQWEAST